jgi:phosphoribosyl 1,2-cyclic phosphodiesterase
VTLELWGTRGSVASPGAETARYGGNTSCASVRGPKGSVLVLDAGTGIRRLGRSLAGHVRRVDVLLSHLHMDHVQGLGFFAPLFDPAVQTHLWGPASLVLTLRTRLVRYLSPPLFPVHLRDLPRCHLHELEAEMTIGEFRVRATHICHPGFTFGLRIETGGATIAYLSDHEPALGATAFPGAAEWTSGYPVARGADLLLHDAQYTAEEYPLHEGWGHSSIDHAIAFAELAHARHLVTFHHDPAHDDDAIDRMTADAVARLRPSMPVTAGAEGAVFEVS